MTDLEKELLERVIALTVQLNEEKAVREHNDFVYTDFQEVIARLREELKASQAQGKELCTIVDGLKSRNTDLNEYSADLGKTVSQLQGEVRRLTPF